MKIEEREFAHLPDYPVFIRAQGGQKWIATCRALPDHWTVTGHTSEEVLAKVGHALYSALVDMARQNEDGVPPGPVSPLAHEIMIRPQRAYIPVYRELVDHRGNAVNDCLVVVSLDERHSDGSHAEYVIESTAKSKEFVPRKTSCRLNFHRGDPEEVGVTGITHEALLTVLIDRVECLQRGPFASTENDDALYHLREALKAFKTRTANRAARGVEGKPIP